MRGYKIGLLEKIKQNFISQIITCIALSLIVIFTFLVIYNNMPIKYEIINDSNVINDIEEVNVINNKINIKGYAFYINSDSSYSKINILLRNVNGQDEIWTDVEQIHRTDVNEYFRGNYNHDFSGFMAYVKEKKLKSDECYEILVKLDFKNDNSNFYTSKTVSTNRYIVNGKLYSYNPFEFIQPIRDVESELLQDVFTKGKLCFYLDDIGIYVYQYDDKLYWIADEKFKFNEDGLTFIQYQIYTSQKDKLPEHRIQHGFDNLGFYFEEYEYKDENTYPYRVAIQDLPYEYPITSILTGVYNSSEKSWVWSKQFQIEHNFQ